MPQQKSTRGFRTKVAIAVSVASLVAGVRTVHAEPLPLDEFSPMFLGMYRKVMEIEDEIRLHARKYGVDVDLARAVCLYESGGNGALTSHAGAAGYFQVMPGTLRELKVQTNIEAGIKYLSQMIARFGREDRAVAAYNGGPGRIGRGGALPLETLQYVIGVGQYRTLLKQHDDSLRHHASSLKLAPVRAGDDWPALASRLGIEEWELRLHNPFLAGRALRPGHQIAYPQMPRRDLLTRTEDGVVYRTRLGDNYITLAITLGVDVDALRARNGLWHLQSIPSGLLLRIPSAADRADVVRTAVGGGAAAEPAADVTPDAVSARIHRVKPGETLTTIARKYGTTVAALQRANGLRGTRIRASQQLRIPGGPKA